MVCKECNSTKMHRIHRRGFLQTKLAPKFDFFPWECSICRHQQLERTRNEHRSSHDKDKPRKETLSQAAGHPRPNHIG